MLRLLALLSLASLAACEDEPVDANAAARNQIALLDIQLRQLEMRTSQYADSMAVATDASCISIHRTYNLDVRMLVFRMEQLETDLDASIATHGGEAYADIACSVDALVAELDLHEAVACQDATIDLDRTEAARHLDAVTSIREHLLARSAEVAAGLDAGSVTWTFAAPSSCP